MAGYIVNCIEHGERFFFREDFDTTDGPILEQAQEIAMLWGAEVISIEEDKDA